jgi:virulence-associated protein VapD
MNLPNAPIFKFSLIAIVAGFACMGSSQLQAGASNKNGNPYGNGTFFQTTGTFSAVVRGQNLSGTMLFSTGVNTNGGTTNNAGGSTVIVYGGYTYQGNTWGMWDPSSGSVSGVFQGGQMLSGTNSTSVYPEIYNSTNTNVYTDPSGNTYTNQYFPYPINVVSNALVTQTIFITNGTAVTTTTTQVYTNITNTFYVEPYGSNNYQDSLYLNGSFNGQMQNQYPNQTFTAQGEITQQQLYPQQVTDGVGTNAEGTTPVQLAAPVNINITVQGVRISDTYANFNTISNAIPYSMTTYTITNIPGKSFSGQ